jgi:hypothetical protein
VPAAVAPRGSPCLVFAHRVRSCDAHQIQTPLWCGSPPPRKSTGSIFFGSDSGVHRALRSNGNRTRPWTRALGYKSSKSDPPLDSGSRVQSKSDPPLDSGSRVQSKSDPPLNSDSGAHAQSGSGLDSGSWFGRWSGLELGGRVPPPLSQHWAWERATSPTGQRSKGA